MIAYTNMYSNACFFILFLRGESHPKDGDRLFC